MAFSPDDQRVSAVGLDVHLLERATAWPSGIRSNSAARSMARRIDRASSRRGPRSIDSGRSPVTSGSDAIVGRIAGLELLERLAVRRREVGVAERDERGGLALGDVDDDRPGQAPGEASLRRSTGRPMRRARAASRSATKTFVADGEAALGEDRVGASGGRCPTTATSVIAKRALVMTCRRATHATPTDVPATSATPAIVRSVARTRAKRPDDAGRSGGCPDASADRGDERRLRPRARTGRRDAARGRDDAGRRRLPGVTLCSRASMASSSRALALMSPAPSAMTSRPGSTISASAAATCFLSRTNVTAWWPCARIASASSSPLAPSIGFSPAG